MISHSLRLAFAFGSLLLALAPAGLAAVTEKFSQTYGLSANGTISIDNVNGDIEIVAWDKADVSLEAIKSAKTDEKLKRISVEVDAQPSKLTIKTKFAKSEGMLSFNNADGGVHYKLMVPAGVSLKKIDSVNSNITVTDVKGDVDLETTNGRITAKGLVADATLDTTNGTIVAEFASVDRVKSIRLDSTNGGLTLTLPKGANAQIDADTTNGRINVEQAIKLSKSSKRTIRGEIGTGGPSVKLDTTNGSVSIKEAK